MEPGESVVPQLADELLTYFVTHQGDFAWTRDVREKILARRAALQGELFFDILLKVGDVASPASLYPPSDLRGLKALLDAILSASYDSMKVDCLFYYLLKQSQDGREEAYVSEKVISPQYVALLDAYWLLDNDMDLEVAISKFSDARIVKEYSTKIMETLALDANSGHLIRKFVRTCRPALREPSDMKRYIVATAELSVVEAWKYQRTFPDKHQTRKFLLRRLLVWTLTPKPKAASLKQLLSLPFNKYEDAVLRDFAEYPPDDLSPASIEVVRDLVCVRLIQAANYAEAVRFDRQYPGSAAAPRGTWGAERGRIVKDIFSILPRVERDTLQNEAVALDQDARMRRSSGASSSKSQSRPSSNLGSSGSIDLGGSWEDLGRRTSGPSRSSGAAARPRASFSNGSPVKPLFTPGATTSSSRSTKPLSTQSTFVSQNGAADSPLRRFSPIVTAAGESPASAARLFTKKTSTVEPQSIRAPNGEAKANSSNARNAFFVPPVEPRTPSPRPTDERRSTAAPSPSPRRTQTAPATKLPTPPRDESEKTQSPVEEEEQAPPPDEQAEVTSSTSSTSVSDEEDHAEPKERSGLGFSIFGSSTPTRATRLSPSSSEVSPNNNRRKYQDEGVEGQRKKLKVSVPGAFTSDDEHENDHEHDLPSPTSATVQKPHARAPTRRTPTRTLPTRRSSRKRSASPDDEIDSHPISIPGTLFEDEEDTLTLPNGHTEVPPARQNGHVNNEEADQLGPLPPHRGKLGLAGSTSSLRTPRRTARSVRGNSADPEDKLASQSTGRPVRRSSRLQSVEVSPTAEHAHRTSSKKEKKLKEKVQVHEAEKETRPRKSTRTTKDGATATGRGSSRRR